MKNILAKFEIDYSTYILILLALLAGYIKHTFIILLIVIIHELGHIFFFKLFKIDILKITIYPFGGVTQINKKIHERIYKDILCSLGGILFQLILWLFFYFLYTEGNIASSTYNIFTMYNKNVLFFNLIPIIPLDGSKIILSILTKYFSFKKSYIISIIIGVVSLLTFMSYNIAYKMNNIVLYSFLIWKLVTTIKEFKYTMNKFYLERVMYDHFYDKIINNCSNIDKLRIDKFYYFKKDKKYINEKDYIKKHKYRS